MLNDFFNGFDEFKKKYDNMPEEEFMSLFYDLGITFVPIEECTTESVNNVVLKRNTIFHIDLQKEKSGVNLLIA